MENLKTILAILLTILGIMVVVLFVFILTDYVDEAWYVIYAFIYFPFLYWVRRKWNAI